MTSPNRSPNENYLPAMPTLPFLLRWWVRHVAPVLYHTRLRLQNRLLSPRTVRRAWVAGRLALVLTVGGLPLIPTATHAAPPAPRFRQILPINPILFARPEPRVAPATVTGDSNATNAIINVASGAAGDVDDAQCSLVEAILNASFDDTSGSVDCTAGSGTDTINLPMGATLSYTAVLPGAETALPEINSTITINGNNSTITRTGVGAFGILSVVYPGDLTLNNATISGGSTTNTPGSGGFMLVMLH